MDLMCPAFPKDYLSMRELSQDTPTLFDAPPPATVLQAKDFVRWCCSFGTNFRNSPDIGNLRYWAQKNKVKIKQRDEIEILQAARAAFRKRIEQLTRKSEPVN
jgi:hypothetical protein